MAALLEPMEAARDRRRYFHATYLRTTIAVAGEITRGRFADAEWVERWDVVFAGLYLDALEANTAGRPPGQFAHRQCAAVERPMLASWRPGHSR